MRTTIAALAATAACLTLAGCGDDTSAKDDAGDRPASLTKAEYIKQGDAICKASNDRIKAAGDKVLSGEPTQDDYLAYIKDTLLPEVEGQAADLRALPAPDEGADDVTAMLDALDAEVEKAKADPAAMMTSDESGFEEANKLAIAYGFKVCGADG